MSFTISDDNDDPINRATVIIGGVTKTTGSAGGCTVSLSDGEHSVQVSKDGYVTKTENITVDKDHTSFIIKLAEE